jgi:hypothetical protein
MRVVQFGFSFPLKEKPKPLTPNTFLVLGKENETQEFSVFGDVNCPDKITYKNSKSFKTKFGLTINGESNTMTIDALSSTTENLLATIRYEIQSISVEPFKNGSFFSWQPYFSNTPKSHILLLTNGAIYSAVYSNNNVSVKE